jgi:hypothetical protein
MVFESKKTFVLVSIAMTLVAIAMLFAIFSKPKPKAKPSEKQPTPITEQEIKTQFSAFINKSQSETISADIQDSTGKAASLDAVSKGLDFQIYQPIKDLCYENSYQFFSCQNEGSKKDFGLVLDVNSKEENIRKLMGLWEKQLLTDLHSVLFPNTNFSSSVLEQPLSFQDGLSRYSKVTLPDNSEGSINYKVVNESIFISSSPDCLTKGSDTLFDP